MFSSITEITDLSATKVNDVLELSKTSSENVSDEPLSALVSTGAKLKSTITRLTTELEAISTKLKIFGTQTINSWNKTNIDNIKSTRIYSDNISALITVKTVNKVDRKTIAICKPLIPEAIYNTIFEDKMTRNIKPEFAEKLISLLEESLGKDFVAPFIDQDNIISLKDKDVLDSFLINSDIDLKLREKVKGAVKQTETSITYSK
jgi:hypothetical protein